jgi:hypothetical protein
MQDNSPSRKNGNIPKMRSHFRGNDGSDEDYDDLSPSKNSQNLRGIEEKIRRRRSGR